MNIDATPEGLARIAVQGLRLEPSPTEEEIDWILQRLAAAFEYGPNDVAEARKLLHARFSNRWNCGKTIKGEH
jgi:hypothetical protein